MSTQRRVRHELADAVRLMAFSAAVSVGLAMLLWVVATVTAGTA